MSKQPKAIVTGATGGVSINLMLELLAHGYEVTAVPRPDSPRAALIPAHPSLTVVPCDLTGYAALPAQLAHDYDLFFHLAWAGPFGEERNDTRLQLVNIQSALDAVDAAHALGCRVFVGAGSQSEYGAAREKLRPDMPCLPTTGYGAAKLAASVLTRVRCGQLGLRQNWCRVLSLYGPYDGMHTGVMTLIRTFLNGERPRCTPGDQVWDYTYAGDVAQAFRLTAEKGRDGAVYCVGSGETRTLRRYIEAIRDAVDPALAIGFGEIPYYPNQAMHLEADISALCNDTGYQPQYSFERGIRATVEWVRGQKGNGGKEQDGTR